MKNVWIKIALLALQNLVQLLLKYFLPEDITGFISGILGTTANDSRQRRKALRKETHGRVRSDG